MTLRQRARTAAGFLAVVTLLVLVGADTLNQGVTLSFEDKALLVSLVSALLGVDLALNELGAALQRTSQNDSRSENDDE